jgi:hypothetical protein
MLFTMNSTSIFLRYVDQLRPYPRPVVRTQVFAGYATVRRLLNCYAALDRHRSISGNPLIESRLCNADAFSKLRLAAENFAGSNKVKVFHASIVRHYLITSQ